MDSTIAETNRNFIAPTLDCTPLYLPPGFPELRRDAIGTSIKYAPSA